MFIFFMLMTAGLAMLVLGVQQSESFLTSFGSIFILITIVAFRSSITSKVLIGALIGTLVGAFGGAFLGGLAENVASQMVGIVGGAVIGAIAGVVCVAAIGEGILGFVGHYVTSRYLPKLTTAIFLCAAIVGAIIGAVSFQKVMTLLFGATGGGAFVGGITGMAGGAFLGMRIGGIVSARQRRELAERIGFDPQILSEVAKGNRPRQLLGFNRDGNKVEVDGFFVACTFPEANDLVFRLRGKLLSEGYLIFSTQMDVLQKVGQPRTLPGIAVIRNLDPCAPVIIMRTNGLNYGISNEEVIRQLKEWEMRCPFEIAGAYFGWVDLKLKDLPEDVDAFAKEAYSFCPTIADYGFRTTESLIQAIKQSKRVFCRWH
jgi:hypothetical protein